MRVYSARAFFTGSGLGGIECLGVLGGGTENDHVFQEDHFEDRPPCEAEDDDYELPPPVYSPTRKPLEGGTSLL